MSRIAVFAALITAVAVLVGAASVSARTDAKKLPSVTGTDGPGFTISLKKGKNRVKTLAPGTYRFVIKDKSNIHNFHLKGPGVNKKTGVGFVGTSTWKVKLKAGKYRYVCDPHVSTMHGSFKVK